MKYFGSFLSFLLLLALIHFSFEILMPNEGTPATTPKTEFSTERAMVQVKKIAEKPHYYGSQAHEDVRNYIVSEFEKLGLETEVQEDFVLNNNNRSLNKPKNIVARLKGSGNGKSLLLLSHYDSALVPSYGASDAASGVATILESLRAYLATGKKPKNDVIILISDAEEIGLDGAYLFATQHPWAKNIGIALNFEARGSGGPSNMILESNNGNSKLIEGFIEANPEFPLASSLMYSVYKMLPNDTDSTVLREQEDIDGFFFAFIDDHYDYHTANDTVENLDIESLQHQGSYLLPLLIYFSDADLSQLKSETDDVYLNLPLIKMVHYPFSWIMPMWILAVIIFVVLIIYGIREEVLTGKAIAKGFGIFLMSLVTAGVIGYFGWLLILEIYPQYAEVQQGFKYNGKSYVAFFVLISLAILFLFYKNFKKILVASLTVAPLFFWLLVNLAVAIYLKGAAFFIIPVYFALLSFWILIRQEEPSLLLLALLAAPAIFIFAPLIQFFPVGLGSGMVVISSVFTVLLFGLLIPIVGFYSWKNILAGVSFIGAIVFLVQAHLTSGFSEERQKPNSLIYFQDKDQSQSYWLTYDAILDDWTKKYLGDSPEKASSIVNNVSTSKYGKSYTFAKSTSEITTEDFEVFMEKDSIIGEDREMRFTIYPRRKINQMELYTSKNAVFKDLAFNGKQADFQARDTKLLLRYYVANQDSLEVSFSISKYVPVNFVVQEASFDLMENKQLNVSKRSKAMMPKPFIVTDAVITKKTFSIDELKRKPQDTISANPNLVTNE